MVTRTTPLGWAVVLGFATPFVLGMALFLVSPKGSSGQRFGIGLFFGDLGVFLFLMIIAVVVHRLRGGIDGGSPITLVGQVLILLGVVVMMLTAVLSAAGFNGSTLVIGPDSPLEPLLKAAFALLAAGIPLFVIRPPRNLAAAPGAGYVWQLLLFRLLGSTPIGRAALVLVGPYLGWFVLFGRSPLFDFALASSFALGVVAGVVSVLRGRR